MEEEQEFSFQDLIELLKEYWQIIWKKKYWILAISAVITVLVGGYQYTKKPEYVASVDFMINENEGGGSGIGSILGQFGMGGGSQGGGVNQQKVILIGKSFPVLSDFLLDSVTIDGKQDLVALHIIADQELDSDWASTIRNYVQRSGTSDSIQINFNGVMKSLIHFLKSEDSGPFFDIIIDKKTGMMHSVVKSRSAELSVKLSNRYYEGLSDRYINKTTSAKQRDYDLLTAKKDSIYSLLRSSERQYAISNDRSRGMILQNDMVPSIDRRRKVEMYNQMYVELVTRQQTAEYMLLTTTPVFEILERPMLPLGNSNGFNILYVLFSFIVAAILMVGVLIGRKVAMDYIQKNLN